MDNDLTEILKKRDLISLKTNGLVRVYTNINDKPLASKLLKIVTEELRFEQRTDVRFNPIVGGDLNPPYIAIENPD